MPRVRRGPNGPRRSKSGVKGTNKKTPRGGAGVSGNSHNKQLLPRTKGTYSTGKGY
jgi:hypothetical protein